MLVQPEQWRQWPLFVATAFAQIYRAARHDVHRYANHRGVGVPMNMTAVNCFEMTMAGEHGRNCRNVIGIVILNRVRCRWYLDRWMMQEQERWPAPICIEQLVQMRQAGLAELPLVRRIADRIRHDQS